MYARVGPKKAEKVIIITKVNIQKFWPVRGPPFVLQRPFHKPTVIPKPEEVSVKEA
jgi:hypothetical protein